MRLANKIGIITAAGSGMGRAGAILFASEGARVLVVDLNRDAAEETAALVRSAGGEAQVSSGDLSDEAYARSLVAEAVAKYGRLDFLWNHVGHPRSASSRSGRTRRTGPVKSCSRCFRISAKCATGRVGA